MVGVVICTFSIGLTFNAMNNGLESFSRLHTPIAFQQSMYADGVQSKGAFTRERFTLSSKGRQQADRRQRPQLHRCSTPSAPPRCPTASTCSTPATNQIEIQWTQGIGSEKAAAPQGRLMATVINGILNRKLPWGLVLLGVALVIVVELLGVRSLTFAVGAYLSIATTLAIFVGGVMRWMVDRAMLHHHAREAAAAYESSLTLWRNDRAEFFVRYPDFDATNPDHLDPANGLPVPTSVTPSLDMESEVSPGSLYASGLIAAGGIVGLVGVCIKLAEGLSEQRGGNWQFWRFPLSFSASTPLHDFVSILMFMLLAFSLYYFARKPLDAKTP